MLYKWFSPLSVHICSAYCRSAAKHFTEVCYLQNLTLQTASLTNERAWLWQKNLSSDGSINLLVLGLFGRLSSASLSFILCSIRKVLCRRVFSFNHCQIFISENVYPQVYIKCKLHLKKMLLAYFHSLETTTCVMISLYVESFFTVSHHVSFIFIYY